MAVNANGPVVAAAFMCFLVIGMSLVPCSNGAVRCGAAPQRLIYASPLGGGNGTSPVAPTDLVTALAIAGT